VCVCERRNAIKAMHKTQMKKNQKKHTHTQGKRASEENWVKQ